MSMAGMSSATLLNPAARKLAEVPALKVEELGRRLTNLDTESQRVLALFAAPAGAGTPEMRLFAVLGHDRHAVLEVLSAPVGENYASFTARCPQVHLFEREIFEQYGIKPDWHSWLKPVREAAPREGEVGRRRAAGEEAAAFFQVRGEEVHEVAVGPVHAGVIEPGHFRFQCYGEEVLHLEIALGYQHRGIERALIGGPHKRSFYQLETAAGDTTVGHSWAYCQLLEELTGCELSPRALALRALALELERLANHTGDLGALAGDVAYLPTASYCGRIRGDFLNMTALVCGSRLGRGWLVPGGVRFDLEPERLNRLRRALGNAAKDLDTAVSLLFGSPSAMARFEAAGHVSVHDCCQLGFVGPAARACGVSRDVRRDYPFGYYRQSVMPLALGQEGSVADRAAVRWAEIQNSLKFLEELLAKLPEGELRAASRPTALPAEAFGVSLTEGWRGEICHCCITDQAGRILRYKIVDPSFHNWTALALALRGRQISDFPLCNKSFNLSYAGFDL